MKLRLSTQAVADVERIYLESARQFGIRQADSYQGGLLDSLAIIADHPLLVRERIGFKRPVRIYPYESHVVAYLVNDRGVLVVRILHSHQNLRRIL